MKTTTCAAGLLAVFLVSSCRMHKHAATQSLAEREATTPAAVQAIYESEAYTLFPDRVVQGPFEAKALSRTELISNYCSPEAKAQATEGSWKQTIPTPEFPQMTSDYMLADALYNLALEEARRAVEPDGTFRTGKEWAGVWTRDISYSIILAQAILQPEVAKTSLMRKVTKEGHIIQDTGTGGAYPCSTDRMIWAVAAWEIYLTTGDEDWLQQVYPIIKNSINDDLQNAFDEETGLMRGESSFLDWREQTYPRWMQPADIYQSLNLGTNAVHFRALQVMGWMAHAFGEGSIAEEAGSRADRLGHAINRHLWQPDKGYYAQYLYGREHMTLLPRSEALGEALCVLFNLADSARARIIVERTPVGAYGIPCIWPQIPGIPPYHNNAVWPFVQSYWGLAAAKAGNEAAFMESLAAVWRPAALFLTNKENFVAANGDYAGTQINSGVMLWSLSGSLSLVYKGIFGMQFEPRRLVFRPFVPKAIGGKSSLTGFHYRKAILDIEMLGSGSRIKKITMDGQPLPDATVPAGLTGRHSIRIELEQGLGTQSRLNKIQNTFTLEMPIARLDGNILTWKPVVNAVSYKVLEDGKPIANTHETQYTLTVGLFKSCRVIAVDKAGLESFASEPILVGEDVHSQTYQMEAFAAPAKKPYSGHEGNGFVEISRTVNREIPISVNIWEEGTYAIDFRYANGNGPVNTENKCAIRTLHSDKKALGTIVFPQRGVNEWSNWGWSNPVRVQLTKGRHTFRLQFDAANENMNGEINQAMLDCIRLTRLAE